jgi:hypothetical protein
MDRRPRSTAGTPNDRPEMDPLLPIRDNVYNRIDRFEAAR